MPAFHLSPSRVARYFYHDCDRYLRYHATPHSKRKGAGAPSPDREGSPVAALLLESGYRWEQEVLATHLHGKVVIAKGKAPIHERTHSVPETLRILKDGGKTSIYQPTLAPSRRFHQSYGLNPDVVEFGLCRPDLIDRTSGRALQVVDLKASDELKASHKVQVSLYAMLLRDIVANEGIETDVDLDRGGVWLY